MLNHKYDIIIYSDTILEEENDGLMWIAGFGSSYENGIPTMFFISVGEEGSAIPDWSQNALKQRSKEFTFRKLFLKFSLKPMASAIFLYFL